MLSGYCGGVILRSFLLALASPERLNPGMSELSLSFQSAGVVDYIYAELF